MTHPVPSPPDPVCARLRHGSGLVLLALALLLGTGCKVETLTVVHTAPTQGVTVAAARPVRLEVRDMRQPSALSPQGRRRVGAAGNPFGGGPTLPDYEVAEPIEAIIVRAMTDEFRRFGRVPAVGTNLQVEVGVAVFATEITGVFSMTAHAEVRLQAAVRGTGGEPRWSREVQARVEGGVSSLRWNPQRKASEEALRQALDQAMAELFGDQAFLDILLGP